MRNRYYLLVISGLLATPAFAGLGDVAQNIRERNAICEAQKRGEGPLYPNLCWPDFPPNGPPVQARGRAN